MMFDLPIATTRHPVRHLPRPRKPWPGYVVDVVDGELVYYDTQPAPVRWYVAGGAANERKAKSLVYITVQGAGGQPIASQDGVRLHVGPTITAPDILADPGLRASIGEPLCQELESWRPHVGQHIMVPKTKGKGSRARNRDAGPWVVTEVGSATAPFVMERDVEMVDAHTVRRKPARKRGKR